MNANKDNPETLVAVRYRKNHLYKLMGFQSQSLISAVIDPPISL